jgi:type I restriction enzyme S subunit
MKLVPLEKIVDILDNQRIPINSTERNKRPGVVPYYGATGQVGTIDKAIFNETLILLGEDGVPFFDSTKHKAYEISGPSWVNNHAHVLDGLSEGFLRYMELFINAIDLKPYVTGTAQPKMNQAKMNSIPVAVPPLAEQHRIVAKVDALMALCDRLEASLAASATTRRRLLDALLAEALAPTEANEMEAAE